MVQQQTLLKVAGQVLETSSAVFGTVLRTLLVILVAGLKIPSAKLGKLLKMPQTPEFIPLSQQAPFIWSISLKCLPNRLLSGLPQW